MEKLSKAERQAIRSLMQDGRFTAVEKLRKIVTGIYQHLNVKADTEFQTLWNVASRDAKIEGLDEFFLKLIEEAANDA